MLRRLYLSGFGPLISAGMRILGAFQRPFMVYGYRDKVSGKLRRRTRVSSSATLIDRSRISLGDNVWIGHYCHIDGSNGVTIGEGVQLAAWAGIISHGSQDAVRLLGSRYIEVPAHERVGYTEGSVIIGEYSFIGAGARVMPGVTVGKGCRIDAGALVTKDVPDFQIMRGVPAKPAGDVRHIDAAYMSDPAIRDSYFAPNAMTDWLANKQTDEQP